MCFIQSLATVSSAQHEHALGTSAHGLFSLLHLLQTLQRIQTFYIAELTWGVKGRGWVCLEVRGKTGSMVRYGHIDANALWPWPSCRGCRQKPANVSSSKAHKSQEQCLMAHQHRQKASGHLDGCDLVLCKLAFWGLFTQLVHCKIMWSYDKTTEI